MFVDGLLFGAGVTFWVIVVALVLYWRFKD
jgi:hypothetical protein